eukprot:gnl/Carplike_NY0171/1933_a2613_763.p1 GENE.gnl/Carplike_NY0171/1933_a2613_763~~gnl/Carplike_NY0171/1933_a2613_763.p1  ORF type:complete len:548 (+),score=76.50 gnl/Carplike_NY0171/1933_a2613_763:20-1663(+)
MSREYLGFRFIIYLFMHRFVFSLSVFFVLFFSPHIVSVSSIPSPFFPLDLNDSISAPNDNLQVFLYYTTPLSGMEYAAPIALEIIENLLLSIQIDPFEFDVTTPLGKMQLDFNDISVDTFSASSLTFFTSAESGYTIGIYNATFRISFDFSFRLLTWPYTYGSASIVIDSSNVSLQGSMRIISVNYCQSFNVDEININLGDFNISATGSDIISELLSVLSPEIQTGIQDVINSTFAQVLNELVSSFFLPVTCKVIDDETAIDYRMPFDNVTTDNYSSSPNTATYYGTDSDYYDVPPNLSDPPFIVTNNHFQVICKPHIIASFIHTYRPRGSFDGTVDASMLPSSLSSFPFSLSTLSALFSSLPSSVSSLSSDSPIKMAYTMTDDPNPDMMPGAIALYAPMSIQFSVFNQQTQQWMEDSEDIVSTDVVLTIVVQPTSNYNIHNIVNGMYFPMDAYGVSISASSEPYPSASTLELMLTVVLSTVVCPQWTLLSKGDSRFRYGGSRGIFKLVDEDVWYGEDFFAMLYQFAENNLIDWTQIDVNDDDSICL